MSKLHVDAERVEPSMPSSMRLGENHFELDSPRLLVLEETRGGAHELSALLEAGGHRVITQDSGGDAVQTLRRTRPALAVVAHGTMTRAPGGRLAEFRAVARDLGIPILDVVDAGASLAKWIKESEEIDDWVVRGSSPDELNARVERLLRRRDAISPFSSGVPPRSSPIDARFSALVVHDLRTPLNVIGLSMRMIEQVLPREDPEVEEDLRFIDENFRQIERMLSQLSDYARLFDRGLKLSVSEFDPRRLVDELLENRVSRSRARSSPVRLDIEKSCPSEAELDQGRARMAIEYALINADAAAHNEPIRLALRGGPHRWVIEVAIDRPPPSSVSSLELRPQHFERLCGTAAERRGMELAIAARISELFGGTARLDAVEGRGTTLVLDWPARIPGDT
jgi:signal transduction histidine kinase